MIRVEWSESRSKEAYRVIAEKTAAGWEFWEKSMYEVTWYPMSSSTGLVAKAERLAAKYEPHQRVEAA